MLCTQRPPWISDPDISDNLPVFPSILIINSLVQEAVIYSPPSKMEYFWLSAPELIKAR
jgi:hypothetical protein